MNPITVRNSLIMAFNTSFDRVRSLSVPDPAEYIDPDLVGSAALNIITSDIFDDAPGTPGRLTSLHRADLLSVSTRVLF